jgi:anaerobic selenocysteine-containing dehydrogenase
MATMNRRRMLASGAAAAGGLLGGGALVASSSAHGDAEAALETASDAATSTRRVIPSACWQCVTRCPILGTVDNGRLVKIDGNPASRCTRGRLCARGQAGVNQVDDPDRLLHPLLRVGARGEGRWKKISWTEALDLLVEGGEVAGRHVRGLRELRDAGTPERFLFHYGRTVGSDFLILMYYFLPAYGTGSIGDHNSICIAAGGIARALTGGGAGFLDFERAAMILNFGNSMLEAGLDHVPFAQRWVDAVANGTKLVTFDVRLSNTAARSTEWIPVRPGTDLAVALAMCHVIVEDRLHDTAFIEAHTNVTASELEHHLAPYTPEWAEGISGVPASRTRSLAREYATSGPGICVSGRGAFMHHNGVQAQRALYMLQAVSGNIDPQGRAWARPRWNYPYPFPSQDAKKLDIFSGEPGRYSHPMAGVSHQILPMIDEGPERPDIYMVYCHNPVYSNGDCGENARILSDEEKIPFLVSVDVTLSETSELADLVLPDATYLERWTCDGKTSPEGIAEYQIRQPMHPPRGEARNFCDVACELAGRLGIDLGFASAEEFVQATCDATPGVQDMGGFEYMKAHGVWCDLDAEAPGRSPGPMQIRSEALEEAGLPALPGWMPIPDHESMTDDELVLVTYKVNVHTHSRTQNCKWLSEIYHDNRAWIHPETAAARGLSDGDAVVVRSELGEIVTRVRITDGIHPRAVAISHHGGHWAYGDYASGRRTRFHREEADGRLRWWSDHGTHVNLVIPNRGDPIAGSMCWNDTVVTVSKAPAQPA